MRQASPCVLHCQRAFACKAELKRRGLQKGQIASDAWKEPGGAEAQTLVNVCVILPSGGSTFLSIKACSKETPLAAAYTKDLLLDEATKVRRTFRHIYAPMCSLGIVLPICLSPHLCSNVFTQYCAPSAICTDVAIHDCRYMRMSSVT